MLQLNDEQRAMLLSPLAPSRVASRQVQGRSLSYVEASDIKRWLIRIFGFGGFDVECVQMDLAFEDTYEAKGKTMWNVGYRATVRLTVRGTDSMQLRDGEAVYQESAVGFASLPQRGEAHDMACKTAESDALKRAAIYLGTTFGLSLYFGTMDDVVGRTLDVPQSGTGDLPDAGSDHQATPDSPTPEEAAEGSEATQTLSVTDQAVQNLSDAGMTAPSPAPTTGAEATWFDSLRAAAMNSDEAARVKQVTALQKIAVERFEEGFLDRVTTVKGSEMTIRNLIVECAAGRFLQ